MDSDLKLPESFNLAGGGLLYRILPESRAGKLAMRISFIIVAWAPLLILSLLDGTAVRGGCEFPFLADARPYSRFFIALPILFLAERAISGRLTALIKHLWNTGLLSADQRTKYLCSIEDLNRRCDSMKIDIIVLALAYIYALLTGLKVTDEGYIGWSMVGSGDSIGLSRAGWYYALVSMPIYQYFVLRWLWRIAIWWRFLHSLSRMKLSLVPSHPDRVGGLGVLENGQMAFLLITVAMSAVMSANLYIHMIQTGAVLRGQVPTIVAFVLVSILFVAGPLFFFVGTLMKTKHRGLFSYSDLGDDLFRAFDEKWTVKSYEEKRTLLGNVDPSSLADYGYAYEVVAAMRPIPFSGSGLMATAVVALVPFVPLLLQAYSIKEIIRQLMGILG